MEINTKDIEELLPKGLRHVCKVGICNPVYLERKKRIFCYIPVKYGGRRQSAKPSEVLPSVKSIITLVHFTPIALDYSVQDIILRLASILRRKLKIKTHLLDESGKPSKENIIGNEDSFLKLTSYDAQNKMILLKELAYYAGLGQYGKNSLIINRYFGSEVKIQALFTESKLKYDKPILPRAFPGCKNCNICIEVCPARIIYNYRVITHEDSCRLIAKNNPFILERLPKKNHLWRKALVQQKLECKSCQSFCPVNGKYYQNALVITARKGNRIKYFYSPTFKDTG